MPRSPEAPRDGSVPLLTRGRVLGYDAARMTFLFTMVHGAKVVDCEISSSALDDLDGAKGTRPVDRVAQFERLRDIIEQIASNAFQQQGKREGQRVRIFSKHIKSL